MTRREELHSQALNGAEDSGSPGGDAGRRQKAGTPAHHGCWPYPSLQEGGTNQPFRGQPGRPVTAIPEGLQWTFQALCGFPETHAAGWAPPFPTAAPRPGVDDASRPTAQAASRGLATASGESSNMCQGGLHCPLLHLLPPCPAAASLPCFSGNSQSHPPGRLTAKPPPL